MTGLSLVRKICVMLAAAFFVSQALLSGAGAQTPPAVIIVVDMQRVQDQSAAAKSVQTQIRGFETKLQEQAKAAEEKLKTDELALKQQKTLLSPELFDEKRRAFEAQVGGEQQKLQDRQRDMQAAVRKAQGTLLQTLEPILKQLLTEKGGNIMVDRRTILTASDNLDVTSTVIERLDKKLPALKVEIVKQK